MAAPSAASRGHIACFGDPILDVLSRVEYSTLEDLGTEPGGSVQIDEATMRNMLARPDVSEGAKR